MAKAPTQLFFLSSHTLIDGLDTAVNETNVELTVFLALYSEGWVSLSEQTCEWEFFLSYI